MAALSLKPIACILTAAVLPAWANEPPDKATDKSCDEVRREIIRKYRGMGLNEDNLPIIDTTATAPGKTVGTCAKGSKKILYVPNADRAKDPLSPA
jgi:hypothetical protein